MSKQQKKQELLDIMEADAKDELYNFTPIEWLFDTLCDKGFFNMLRIKDFQIALEMEKNRDKRIALHFMILGIQNKGDYSKIDFYKELEKL